MDGRDDFSRCKEEDDGGLAPAPFETPLLPMLSLGDADSLSKPYSLPRDDDAAARKISRSDITILDSLDYTVYMYLKNRANKTKSCFPAIRTIAADLSLSRSAVCRALSDLERVGFIRREARWRKRGGRSSTLYQVV